MLDLHSRRLLASATSDHPDADLACDVIKIAAAVRGGRAAVDGVIFHTDRGSTYTATVFTMLCRKLGVSQSMGRVGSCFDNAAAEAFFSTLEHEVLSRHHFTTKAQVVVAWCQDFYNTRRRHSSATHPRGQPGGVELHHRIIAREGDRVGELLRDKIPDIIRASGRTPRVGPAPR